MIPEINLGGVSLMVLIGILVTCLKSLKVPSRFLPALAIIGGIVLGIVARVISGIPLVDALVGGAIIGASVSGIYDFGKKTLLGK